MKNHYFYLLKTAWAFAEGDRFKWVITYLMFVISNVVTMAQPFVLALVLNEIQQGGPDLLRTVFWYLLFYAFLDFFFWVFHGVARVWERQMAFHLVKRFNERMFDILSKLPLAWHKDHHSGQVMSRVRKASEALSRFADEGYTYIATAVQFVVSLIAIFILLPRFGFVALGLGVVVVLLIFRFDRILVKNLEEINERNHQVSSTFYDYLTNITTVITLRLEKLAKNELVQKMLHVFPVLKKNIVVNELKWFSISMGLALMNFVILFFYIYERVSINEVIMVGSLTALYQYTNRFIEVFFRLAWQYEQLVWFHTDIRTTEVITSAYDRLPTRFLKEEAPTNWKKISIQKLFFRYEDEKKRVHNLKNIRLEFERGLKIAFVGESGSGKSTLMTLIRGLNDVNRVEVDIDGTRHKSLRVLSNLVTLIPQDAEIFENTIEYNVTAGIRHTKAQVLEVCEWARFTKVLTRLPKGLKTHIKEKGVNLSGGEKQRLALARGLFAARTSSVILLDEPTSSVDSKNEMAIYENLFRVFDDRCIISSVHRLHLLNMFDVIYVFDAGELVAKGDFDTLLKTNTFFKKLWKLYQSHVAKH